MHESLEQCMAAYADGDEEACTALYRTLAPRLLAFFRRSGMADSISSELVQQTFLRLHLARGRYRRGEPVRPWVLTIAANLLTDELRGPARKRERPFEDGEAEQVPAQEPDPGVPFELSESLQRALEQLPEAQREVVLMHKYKGMPFQDVADATGVSLTAVRVRAFRAYEALRRTMRGGGR